MSWSWTRFFVVAVFTLLVLAPLGSLMAPMVNELEEPWLTVVIILTAVVVYFVIDRVLELVLRALRRRNRPET